MWTDTIYNVAFGLLFFLASSYFFDLVCREQYIDNIPNPFDGKISDRMNYGICYIIFFVFNAISLIFLAFSNVLLGYIGVQFAIIILSLLKMGHSKKYLIYTVDILSVVFFMLLIFLRFVFKTI